jgi:hypothetical protein
MAQLKMIAWALMRLILRAALQVWLPGGSINFLIHFSFPFYSFHFYFISRSKKMKLQKFISVVIALTIAVIANADAAVNTKGLAVYSFQKTEPATLDTSAAYQKQFLGTGDRLVASEDGIVRYVSARDVNTTLEHNLATGDISFNRNFSRYLGSFVPKLPAGDEAQKYAEGFLSANKLLPLNRDELKVAHIGGLRASSVLSDGKAGPTIDKLVTLTYSRQLNGVPVIGAGSKIIVNLGDSGEIVSVSRRWRELDKPIALSETELLTEAEAYDLVKRQILSEFGDRSSFEVLQTQIAYFDNNGTSVQPVFAFQTKIQPADQKLPAVEYVGVIPAMRKPIEALNLVANDPAALRTLKAGDSGAPGEQRGGE